jgi:GxxExxY protein
VHGADIALESYVLAEKPFNELTGQIIGAAIEVHQALGPGLLEAPYIACLEHELTTRRLAYVRQRTLPVRYKNLVLHSYYRIDLIVEHSVVVEVKSVERLLPVHQAQVLTYLALTGCPTGLIINFNVARLTEGVRRLLNPRTRDG